MSAGLFDDEEKDNADNGDLDKLSVNPPVSRDDKKDVRRRKKDKRRKQEVCIILIMLNGFMGFSCSTWLRMKLKSNLYMCMNV